MASNSQETLKRQFGPPFSSTTFTLLLIIFLLLSCFAGQTTAAQDRAAGRLIEAGEEGIMMFFDPCEILTGVGTLTSTPRRVVPAAVTRINQDMIRNSGARSLYELFDIYVPNFQWIKHHYDMPHMGLRGIISDKDDKYLLLVNGRTMNARTDLGAVSERDLPMLDDIHHIDVVRGPGSAIYGLGAISMVIDIHTENANTFQGSKVTTKVGAFEEFVSFEYKHGTMLDEDTGLYLYGGISDYAGADRHDSPQIYGFSDITRWGRPIRRGKPVSYDYTRDRKSWRGLPKLKFHAELTKENLDLWARYTRGGEHFTSNEDIVTASRGGYKPPSYEYLHRGVGYQQFTAYGKYHHVLTDTLSADYVFSYDLLDIEQGLHRDDRAFNGYKSWREDEYLTRVVAKWVPDDRHSVAFGFENSTENFGLRSPGFPHTRPTTSGAKTPGVLPRWSTNTTSLFGEYQFSVNPKWTMFLGMRADRSTYSDEIYSPRAAAVYTPTDKDTLKFMFSRSARPGFAQRIRNYYKDEGNYAKPEVLEGFEFRYERQHSKKLSFAGSLFFNKIDIIGWDAGVGENMLGQEKTWGLEFEAAYTSKRLEVTASHGYTDLMSFKLDSPDYIGNIVTTKPYDYGDDLSNWSNQISKVYAKYKVNEKLSVNSSLIIYWGFPGLEDMTRYQATDPDLSHVYYKYGLMDYGYDKPFSRNIYLNLGLAYKASKNLNIRVNGHNLLGLFDRDLNKRNYLGRATYRIQAPAISVAVEYRF